MDFRPTTTADLATVLSVRTAEPVDRAGPERYAAGLRAGTHRPEWTWLALAGNRVLGRAVWSGEPGADAPHTLACLLVDPGVPNRVTVAERLIASGNGALTRGGGPLRFEQWVEPGYRANSRATAALAWRDLAVRRAGLTDRVERRTAAWVAGSPLPEPSGELAIEPETDDDVVLDALTWSAVGTLDVPTRRGLAVLGPAGQARADLDFFYAAAGRRAWWRLAWTWHGRLVGVVIPTRMPDGTAAVGWVGVLPEFRGHHHGTDLLAWATRFQARTGVDRVVALTETVNTPMVAALDRCGYRTTALRITWDRPAVPAAVSAERGRQPASWAA